ncbi:MAG: MBL fold metallo-hydrolase [Syntrophomonadaceae bacterium]|nr:MBL fold metallo-hydrolase [Syntrophomonadaceae bacterium]
MIKEVDLPEKAGLYTIMVPSIFPTGDTRCYLGEGDDGWTIVDCGVRTDQAQEIWTAGLRRIGIGFKDIKHIFLTHNHPDHYGLAGWLQHQSGAIVHMSSADINTQRKYSLPQQEQLDVLLQDMKPYGIPVDLITSFVKDIEIIKQFSLPLAEVLALESDQLFRMGDDQYEFILVPGHSDGHVMYVGLNQKRVLSGDSMLFDRVSQISDWPYSVLDNPLEVQLNALRELAKKDPGVVLTAHGPIFEGIPSRIVEIENLFQRRLNKVLNLLQRDFTLPELCQTINVRARVLQEMRVSWADTRAYLEYMWRQNKISKHQDRYIKYGPVSKGLDYKKD